MPLRGAGPGHQWELLRDNVSRAGPTTAGTVFKITPSGTLTTLLQLLLPRTAAPTAPSPTRGWSRPPMGTSTGQRPVAGSQRRMGTVFKITPSGTLTTLHSFDEHGRRLPLRRGWSRPPMGTSTGQRDVGGANGDGTVFKITPSGTLTTLYSFRRHGRRNSLPRGWSRTPMGTSTGQREGGGANGDGTVFSLSVGLGPFVETQPTSGKVGAAVKILGTNLTGATSVTFNGTAADLHRGLEFRNHDHRTRWRHHRQGQGDDAQRHAQEQRGLPGDEVTL